MSATLIVLNEADRVGAALESLRWADEIVVVDAGSSDNTIEVCRRYTDKIFVREWTGYVDQKNFAAEKASYDWIFSLDADERVSAALREEIEHWRRSEADCDGYAMPRKTFLFGRWIKHTSWYPDYQLRLYNRKKGRWQGGRVHESVAVSGRVGRFSGEILHYTYRNFSDYLRRLDRYSQLAAEDYYERGGRPNLAAIVFAPPLAFLKNYLLKRGFLDGYQGFIVSAFAATSVLFKQFKLWELYRSRSAERGSSSPSVLFIDTERVWRGGQDQLLSLMRGLKARGWRVALIADPRGLLLRRAAECGIAATPLPIRGEFDPLAFFRLYRILKKARPAILHYNTPRPLLVGWLAARRAGVPISLAARRVDFPLRKNPFSRFKYNRAVDKIIAVSHAAARTLAASGVAREKIEVINEGIDLSEFDSLPGPALRENRTSLDIGTVGHLSREKGHRDLLLAAAIIANRAQGVRFWIVGDGELRGELEAEAARLGLGEKVRFTGFRHDAPALLKSFDMFVLPSLSEGFPMVLLYAMAAALPIVATRVGGVVEIIEHGATGLLVPPARPEALAEAMLYLIEHKGEAERMGRAARRRVEEFFTVEAKVRQTEEVYRRLMNGILSD